MKNLEEIQKSAYPLERFGPQTDDEVERFKSAKAINPLAGMQWGDPLPPPTGELESVRLMKFLQKLDDEFVRHQKRMNTRYDNDL